VCWFSAVPSSVIEPMRIGITPIRHFSRVVLPTLLRRLLGLMAADQSCTVMARIMPIHPSVSELLPTLLQQLQRRGRSVER
jgi:hypothetical protein